MVVPFAIEAVAALMVIDCSVAVALKFTPVLEDPFRVMF